MAAENVQSKPNYGIDAPGLVRFFFIAGAVALFIFLVVLFSSILGQIPKITVGTLLGIAATYLLGMGCFMLYGSKVMKLKDTEKLLNLVQWSGSELVLDVGCGRGLMLVGAAKRLTSGKAIGIDLWHQHDQANNSSAADSGDDRVIDCAMNAGAIVIKSNIRDFQRARQSLGLLVMKQQEQSFNDLVQELGQASSSEIEAILAERELVEPEEDLSEEARARLQQRIRTSAKSK